MRLKANSNLKHRSHRYLSNRIRKQSQHMYLNMYLSEGNNLFLTVLIKLTLHMNWKYFATEKKKKNFKLSIDSAKTQIKY